MAFTISGNNGLTFPNGNSQSFAGIGTDQTWQNLTASRAKNTTYTNSTGRPIFVQVSSGGGTTGDMYVTVNGVQIWIGFLLNGTTDGGGGVIVPPGATYSVQMTSNLGTWWELR